MDINSNNGLYTMEDALRVAGSLKAVFQRVERVEVFGRIAREGRGFDIDLLVCVDDDASKEFFSALRGLNSGYSGSGKQRFNVAFEGYGNFSPPILVCRETLHEDDIDPYIFYKYMIDVFLVPMDWRNRLRELQDRLPHKDPRFMWNIARDARVIA